MWKNKKTDVRSKYMERKNQVFNADTGSQKRVFHEEVKQSNRSGPSRRTMRTTVDIFDMKEFRGMFIPIAVHDHYIAAVVCHSQRTIHMLDWYSPSAQREKKLELHGRMLRHALSSMQGKSHSNQSDIDQYTINMAYPRKIQMDHKSCGVYALMCMWRMATLKEEELLSDAVKRLFQQLTDVEIWVARYWISLCIF